MVGDLPSFSVRSNYYVVFANCAGFSAMHNQATSITLTSDRGELPMRHDWVPKFHILEFFSPQDGRQEELAENFSLASKLPH